MPYSLFQESLSHYRVVYVFGDKVQYQVTDITPTFLSQMAISTLRAADHAAYEILKKSGGF